MSHLQKLSVKGYFFSQQMTLKGYSSQQTRLYNCCLVSKLGYIIVTNMHMILSTFPHFPPNTHLLINHTHSAHI